MKRVLALLSTAALSLLVTSAQAKEHAGKRHEPHEQLKPGQSRFFKPGSVTSSGTVIVEGRRVRYRAVAGTLVVHPKGWDDAARPSPPDKKAKAGAKGEHNPGAEASMFYVAYFKRGVRASRRPITFLFNGGPGSSTVWLHMGAFGPRRVITADDTHTPAAPYKLVNNRYSLLDASDLVFIDAPATGFSRVEGKGKNKAFFGIDPDAHAFAEFITQFLSKYNRWNSPKYMFGESYGTPRAAVLVNLLETDYFTDFNGVILLSQILNFDLSDDGPEHNPGIELPYELALPTYAATAWYHHKLPGANRPAHLRAFLNSVESYATNEYAHALALGSALPQAKRNAVAEKLHEFTGLPVSYILKANLRIDGSEFEKNLQDGADMTTGRLDTRFSGPSMDPLSKDAEYDPQMAAIGSAYVSAFNDYVRRTLKYGKGKTYRPLARLPGWNFKHKQPGGHRAGNTMPDLAMAMKYNPGLEVLLTGGYFDLATPFFEGWYEMHHLNIPRKLQKNIHYRYYRSGHMVYVHRASLKPLHDDVSAFIRATDHLRRK